MTEAEERLFIGKAIIHFLGGVRVLCYGEREKDVIVVQSAFVSMDGLIRGTASQMSIMTVSIDS